MRRDPLSVLSTLSAAILGGFATPLAPRWNEMRVNICNDVPKNWENLSHPPNETTIDLHLALKSYRENDLIDALYEVSNPRHLRYVPHRPLTHACTR